MTLDDQHEADGPAGAVRPVVFLGDSLTAGGDWAAEFPELTVVNAGASGDTTGDILERLGDVTELDPAAIVIMAGTNDLALRATVEQTVRGMENILVTLHRDCPDARIIIQSVLPRERERAADVREVNIHLRQFAATVKAEFVDLWTRFADDDGELAARFSDDRLHLGPAGYAEWADALRPVLGEDQASTR